MIVLLLSIDKYLINILLDLRIVSGIGRDPLLHSSGVPVCSIRIDRRAIQQQQQQLTSINNFT